MLIRVSRGWEIPEREATPESVYENRREILKAAGVMLAASVLGRAAEGGYAAARSKQFTLDRPVTEEWAATSYNNYYEFHPTDKQAPRHRVGKFVTSPWTVEVSGMGMKARKLDLDDLRKRMPLEERLYRFRCVEAWSMAVPWVGFPMAALIKELGPPAGAKYVRFETVNRPEQMPGMAEASWYPWPYFEGLRMDEAMNPLAMFVVGMYGKVLPKQNGAPVRAIVPWKYGYKSAKSIARIEFLEKQPATFWNQSVPKEYGFYSNVNPERPHPRWSQAVERVIPTMERMPTQKYNGYGKWVEGLYRGDEF